MGAVKIDKMRKRYEESKRGGDFIGFEIGDTKAYIHGVTREDDDHPLTEGLNYVPVVVHYGLGKDRKFAMCLDPEANQVLKHPFLRPHLKKKGIKLTGTCPVCRDIDSGSFTPDEANDARAQTKYLFGVTPFATRSKASEPWKAVSPKPGPAMVGKSIYEGLVELYADSGDISELTSATLARVSREGKGKNDTKYKVAADTETVKKPLNITKNKELYAIIKKAILTDGDCDLFRVAAGLVKSAAEVEAIISGVKTEDSDDEDDEEELDEAEADESDDEEEVEEAADEDEDVPAPKKSKKPAPKEEDEEEEAEDSDEEEESAPPKKVKKPAPKVEEEEEEEADEDSEDAEDEEEEEPTPKAKPKVKKPAPKVEEEEEADEDEAEDSDDEEETEDEEEEEPAPKPKAKDKKPAKDDDAALDDLDAELDRMSKKKKK